MSKKQARIFRLLKIIRKRGQSKPRYLANNSWEKEFNFKLWVTKGTRFAAAKRLNRMAWNSKLAQTLLSSYLIIIGISPFILKAASKNIDADILALFTTGASVLLLVYSLLESSKGYELKAHQFDECAIKVSKLYNKLRQAKEFNSGETEMKESLAGLTDQYDDVLEGYDNHEPIDYAIFQTQKRIYHGLSRRLVWKIKAVYCFKVYFVSYLFIAVPPVSAYLLLR